MNLNLSIHGHFYQPPREDPISDYIPDEIGAEPYHNWNERIMAECYEPNARVGNFGKISFNIGPTLFNWMQQTFPDVTELIVTQERANFERDGYGNGMAQAYNHTILPLATRLDKITQVRWGLGDFIYRFGHQPEGIWLPETAADTETLCVLSDLGLKFTILAPWQVSGEEGSRSPYSLELPEGRPNFTVFTYDRDLSTQVSFLPEKTVNGDAFLYDLIASNGGWEGFLRIIASDGELYGHHQPFRNYFLEYLLNGGAEKHGITWSWPGKWLHEHPGETRAGILQECSSWSCLHGCERWARECDCTSGANWKEPMRAALNEIAEWVDTAYLDLATPLFEDPWELRHRYVDVLTGQKTTHDLCLELSRRNLSPELQGQMNQLLKAQYERQRMFTSCGWFFDDFHRIEPQNNIAYAANAVWMTQRATGLDLSPVIMELLKDVRSNRTGLRADTIFSQTLMRARAETGA